VVAKKSKFVGKAARVETVDDAMEWVRREGDPEASHNCFAYKIGQAYRSTDDGEPGGTAGRPMLASITQEGLDCVAVLVTRYYGGTKLGTGGLVRAYGQAARLALQVGARTEVRPRSSHVVSISFDDIGPCFSALEQLGVQRAHEEYSDDGVRVTVVLEDQLAPRVSEALKQATSGRVAIPPTQ